MQKLLMGRTALREKRLTVGDFGAVPMSEVFSPRIMHRRIVSPFVMKLITGILFIAGMLPSAKTNL